MRRFFPLLAVLALGACTSIDSTDHCVETRYGDVVTQKMKPGLTTTFTTATECFPLTQQTWPSGKGEDGQASAEKVSFITKDSVSIENAEIALLWKYTDAGQAFGIKRTHDAVLVELSNAVRSGVRDFGATLTLPMLLGAERANLDEAARKAIQDKMSPFVQIEKVYLRSMEPPANIKALWSSAMAQQGEQTKARAQFVTDSLNARRNVMLAEARAKETELKNRALAANPEVLKLERDRSLAEASAKLLSSCTSNCFIGGDAFTRSLLQTVPRQ
jgi:regulator of protease activity HflC (stomatin/prohibitin superfamily)